MDKKYVAGAAGTVRYAIADTPGTAASALSVGSHVNRVTATNAAGQSVNTRFPSDPFRQRGDLAFYSVFGPTHDGRMKPEITAPSDGIYAFPEIDFGADVIQSTLAREIEFDGQTWQFTIFPGGTSSSAPVAAGVAALVLEANPPLSSSEVKEIIINSARVDDFVTSYGPVPNDAFGYGKIDALGAVQAALLSVSNQRTSTFANKNQLSVYPNPSSGTLHFEVADRSATAPARVFVLDAMGRRFSLPANGNRVDVSKLPAGSYLLEVSLISDPTRYFKRFVKQ